VLFPLVRVHPYTEDEYRAVLSELNAPGGSTRTAGCLRNVTGEHREAQADWIMQVQTQIKCGCPTGRAADRNIECLEENRALLSRCEVQVLSHEQKEPAGRLTKPRSTSPPFSRRIA
jgi:hypothetical protein